MSDLVTRLRKLLALAGDSDTPESRTARKLYESLLERYGLDHEEVADTIKKLWSLTIPAGTRQILGAICESLGIEWGYRLDPAKGKRGKRKVFGIFCTERQKEVVTALFSFSANIYLRKRIEGQAALRGYLYGHLHGLYPLTRKPPHCPKCDSEAYEYDEAEDRWHCPACRHKGRRALPLDPGAYRQGRREAARPVLGAPHGPELPFESK